MMLIPSSIVKALSTIAAIRHVNPLTAPAATTIPSFDTTTLILPSVNDLSPVAAFLSLGRGGGPPEFFARKASVLDIGRVRMRLEGLSVYATLCALLTNACLRLYSSIQVPDASSSTDADGEKENDEADEDESDKNSSKTKLSKQGERLTQIALDAFYVCVVICVLCGSYTTIVFGLFSLLSKTALGRGYDEAFLEFWMHTSEIRESGFESFLYSLVAFEFSFVISLVLRFEGRRRRVLVILACLILIQSMRRWTNLLYLATKYLFPLRAEVEY